MQPTRRGWALITGLAMLAGAALGTVTTSGDNPCEYAVTTVSCR